MKRGLPPILWVLLGLLAVGAGLIRLGERDVEANPTADSRAPSGTSAFAELLRSRFDVRIDHRAIPRLAPTDLAVVFLPSGMNSNALGIQEEPDTEPIEAALREHLYAGGRVLLLPLDRQFQAASQTRLTAGPSTVNDPLQKRTFRMHANPNLVHAHPLDLVNETEPRVRLWEVDHADMLLAYQVGNGQLILASDAIALTNRFIDRAENAAAGVAMVELLAGPRGRVVFTEAAFGSVKTPGLLETIGPWAVAGWYQTLFLFLVIIVTLGKPFGVPETDRRKQGGARELLDAVGDTMLRSQHAVPALRSALNVTEAQVRRNLRLAHDANIAVNDDRIPLDVRTVIAEARAALAEPGLTSTTALRLVKRLRSVENSIGEQR